MEFKVTSEARLLAFLFENIKGRSRTTVKSYLTHGQVAINGCRTTRFDAELSPGDIVTISMERTAKALRHPMLKIVFEDEHLLVVDKKNGLLSIGTDKEQKKTAFYILSEHLKREDPTARLFVIHRLDRETSGLMLFAKNQQIQETLQRNWKELVLDRRYVAVTEGTLPATSGTISTHLKEDKNRKMWAIRYGEGSPAVTHYITQKQGDTYSLVELTLETGQKNQIRAHLEWMKTPIAGDKKYNASSNPAGRVCLHASRICFVHPATGQRLEFSTGTPRIFEDILK